MEWPSIVTSFFAQQPQASHHEGINYVPILSLGGNQHPNQQMVHFESTGSVITGNSNRYSSQVQRQLNLSSLVAIQQANQNHINAHTHTPVVTTSSTIPAQVHHPPEPQPPPRVIQNNNPIDTDGCSSSHSSTMHTVAPDGKVTCKQCGEVFQNEEALMQHLRFFHKDIVPFPCQLCNDKFEKRSLLQNHLRKRHHVDTPKSTKKVIKLDNGFFGCDLCDRTFNRQFKVYSHRKTHFPKQFKCDMCDEMFFEKKYMTWHIERRHKKTPSGLMKYIPPPEKKESTHFCQQCEKGFTSQRSLNLHVQAIHLGIKPFNCHLCPKGYWKYIQLKSHCKRDHFCEAKPTATNRNPQKKECTRSCQQCQKDFASPHSLKLHIQVIHQGIKPHNCHLCPKGYWKYVELKSHCKRVHDCEAKPTETKKKPEKKLAYFCQQCEKSFNYERSLKLHIQVIHQGIKPHKCHLCEKGYWKYVELKSHCKRVHCCEPKPTVTQRNSGQQPERSFPTKRNINGARSSRNQPKREPKFFCEFCSMEYTNRRVFILHQQTHLGIANKTPCWLCTEYFPNEDKMNEHLLEIHNQEPVKEAQRASSGYYECQDCDDVFQRSLTYYFHRLNKHGEKRIVCSFCQKGFVRMVTYKCHRNNHVGVKPFVCPFCKVGFNRGGNLNYHVIKSHYRYNPLWCGACNKIYASEDTFRAHREEHEGSSPFMCPTCYKGFDDEEKHGKHVAGFHKPMVEKRYTCHQCRRGFAYPKQLKRHFQVCNKPKLKQFKCQFCETGYSYMSSLKYHLKNCPKNVNKWRPEPAKKKPYGPVKCLVIPDNVREIKIKEDYACKSCLFPFPTKVEILEHLKEKHPKKVPEQSIICCFINPDEERDYTKEDPLLLAEPEIFIRLIIFYCEICKIPYCSPSLLEKHVTKYHPSFLHRFKKLSEEMAPATYTRKSSARREDKMDSDYEEIIRNSNDNTRDANQESQDDSNTEYSGEDEAPKKKLANELPPETTGIKNATATPKYFPCKTCKSLFSDERAVAEHTEKYHPTVNLTIPEKNKLEFEYVCEPCDMHYTEQEGLLSHIENDHNGIYREIINFDKNNSREKQDEKESTNNNNDRISAQDLDDVIDDDDLSCSVCKTKYHKRFYLKKHIEKFHPNYPNDEPLVEPTSDNRDFKCRVCNISYSFQYHLDNHNKKYHNNHPNEDKDIERNRKESDHNDDNREIINSDKSNSQEKRNEKESTSRKNNRISAQDLDDVIDDDDLSCSVCDLKYHKRFYLKKHIEKYHPNYPNDEPLVKPTTVNRDFKCRVCNLSYNLQYHLDNHVKKYHNNYPNEDKDIERNQRNKIILNEDLTCAICKINYKKAIYLVKHIEKYHPNYPEKSGDEILFENNMTQDALSNSKYYKCPVCPVSYSLEPHWVRHMEIVHPNFSSNECTEVSNIDDWDCEMNNKFVCKFCKVEYTKEYYLSKHIERLHPNYYVKEPEEEQDESLHYYCRVCNLPYLYRNNLENHIQKYHPDYYIVYPEEYHPLDSEKEDDTVEGQDSNATEIEVSVDDPIPRPETEPVRPMPPLKPLYSLQDAIVTSSACIPTTNSDQHYQNLNLQGKSNQFNSVRDNSLYQQPRKSAQHKTHQSTQTGFQNCYLQEHNLLPQSNTANSTNNQNHSDVNPSNYSNYNNPCDALSFLDNHLREEQIRVEPNANCHFNRVAPVPPPIPERTNFFENQIIPANDFSDWDRAINQPVTVANNVATSSFGMGNYNPSDPPSFHALQSRHHDRNHVFPGVSTGPTNPVIPTAGQDSDGDDPFDILDTGFGLNYESDDSCDDPKEKESKDPTKNDNLPKKAEEPKVNQFQETFLKFSKKTDEDSEEAKRKQEQAIEEAKSKAFFCKKCSMYYLKDYFLDKHYQKEHPDFWKEIQLEKATKVGGGLVVNVNPDKQGEVRKGALECKICSNLYITEGMMLKHYKNAHADHPDAAPFVEELENFIRTFEEAKEQVKYVCDICNKAYRRKRTLQKHHITAHLNIRPYSCNECDEKFTARQSMLRHVQNVHNNSNETFDCKKCDAKFRRKDGLEKHNRNKLDCVERKLAIAANKDKRKAKNPRPRKSKMSKKKKFNDSGSDSDEKQNETLTRKRTRQPISKSKEFVESDPESSQDQEMPIKTGKEGKRDAAKEHESEEGFSELEETSKSKKRPNTKYNETESEASSEAHEEKSKFKRKLKEIVKENPKKSKGAVLKIILKKIDGEKAFSNSNISKPFKKTGVRSKDESCKKNEGPLKRKTQTEEEMTKDATVESYSDASLESNSDSSVEYVSKKPKVGHKNLKH